MIDDTACAVCSGPSLPAHGHCHVCGRRWGVCAEAAEPLCTCSYEDSEEMTAHSALCGVTLPATAQTLAAELAALRVQFEGTQRMELPAPRPTRAHGQVAYLAALPAWLRKAGEKMDASCFGYRGDYFLLDVVDIEFLAGAIQHVLASQKEPAE